MSTELFVCALDRDCAGHLAVALRRHIDSARKEGLTVPRAIEQLAEIALSSVHKRQQASASVIDLGPLHDGLHGREYLSRADVRRITGASLATVDRWISSEQLRSSKHGRVRRVARADLEEFLRATA